MGGGHSQLRKLIAEKRNIKERAIESDDRLRFGQRLSQGFWIVPLDVSVVFAAGTPTNQRDRIVVSAQAGCLDIQKKGLGRKAKRYSVMFLFGKAQRKIIGI